MCVIWYSNQINGQCLIETLTTNFDVLLKGCRSREEEHYHNNKKCKFLRRLDSNNEMRLNYCGCGYSDEDY